MSFLQSHHKKVIEKDLILLNPEIPASNLGSIQRVILSCADEALNENSSLPHILVLYILTGQNPGLGIKKTTLGEEFVVGGKVTLRGQSMYNFLDRFLFESFSNLRDLKNLPQPAHPTSYKFAFEDIFVFDELTTVYPYIENVKRLEFQINYDKTDLYNLIVLSRSILLCFNFE